MLDTLKDYSIIYSFDRTGYLRHARRFEPIDDSRIRGKRFLVTGGTSGIGAALAERLARQGGSVVVTGRDAAKFEQSSLAQRSVEFVKLDMADFGAVMNEPFTEFDGLVCNAGGMPASLKLVNDEYDLIFASQVIGHYLLLRRFIEQNRLPEQAPIHITSSGGMYLQKLNLDDLCWQESPYDKVKSYANAKRAQVVLNQELAKRYPQYRFSCSHPGWVGTDALREALPGFTRRLEKRLRSNDEGADTMHWCLAQGEALPSGEFWFDRAPRKVYPFFWTRESETTRARLLALCETAWAEQTA
jgi:dehydrogenase/reductase SDR family protein 12